MTHHTGVTQDMRSNTDVLSRTDVKVGALFAPEHGARGDVRAGGRVDNEVDPKRACPFTVSMARYVLTKECFRVLM